MRVALVGTGYIAGRHAAALMAMDNIEIAGHVDVVPEAAAKAVEAWGGKAYLSAEELLAEQELDAVWLCVPPFVHGDLERTFLKAKVPMYIEKPIGANMDAPAQLAQEIADSGVVVNVGYYWRCLERLPEIQTMLAETPPRLVRIAYHGPTAPAAWWRQRAKSGGQVVEQATHLLDTARYLLGEAKVLEATAAHHERPGFDGMDIATATAALLRFEGGLQASFTATCVLSTFADTAIEFLCEGRKITLSLRQLIIEDADGKRIEPTGEDPLVLADKAFIAAVQSNDPQAVPCSYAEALKTQQLCCAIQNQADQTEKESKTNA